MSLYNRVHTPNSPLLPLSPMPSASLSSSKFLSPYVASLSSTSRRSFTPNRLNILPPPSVSPIQAGHLSSKRKSCDCGPTSPEFIFKRPMAPTTEQKSMKKVRSSARKENRYTHLNVPLDSIRRSLFIDDSPPVHSAKISPCVSRIDYAQLKTPTLYTTPDRSYAMYATPQRHTPVFSAVGANAANAANIGTAINAVQYDCYQPIESQFPDTSYNAAQSLLEETFTVMSILKEINMQKYAGLFEREEVDLYVFLMLTYDDMIELGIEEGDRAILMGAIICFKEFIGNPDNSIF